MRPAARLEGVGLSIIRRMNVGAPVGAVSLGLGEPSWPLPEAAVRALGRTDGACAYGPNEGLQDLRDAVAGLYGVSKASVMIGAGSQGVLFSLFQAWSEPGRAVLVPDPGFVAYPTLARLAGAVPVTYPLGTGGRLDAAALIAALKEHPEAAMAIVNHPGNPCGGGADPGDLARVADACRDAGVILVSDEVYGELYLGARPTRLVDVSDYGVSVSSVSKAWGAPGLRVGWAVGDPGILEPARLIHNYMTTAAARPCQEAALALIADSATVLPAARLALRKRWDALASALASGLGMTASIPAGAFYFWLSLPPAFADDPLPFCLRLRDEAEVIVVPGLAFGRLGNDYVRLSFAGEPGTIAEGVRRLAPFWR
jgi:aspartate/methionine/tyrosine aminotransferase